MGVPPFSDDFSSDFYVAKSEGAIKGKAKIFFSTDTSPPTAITDLKAAQGTGPKVFLSWSLPKDNNEVYGYRVYKSREPITEDNVSALSFSFFSNYVATPTPKYLDLTALIDPAVSVGDRWHYAVQAVDTSGNIAFLSNVAQVSITQGVSSPEIVANVVSQKQAVSGALVLVKQGTMVLSQTTDAQGYARFPVSDGSYTVLAKKQGYTTAPEQTVSVTSNDTKKLSFSLSPYTNHIQGKVTSDMMPLSGVTLVAFEALKGDRVEVVSKADGTYDIPVGIGLWKITAEKAGYISQQINVSIPQDACFITGIDFELEAYTSKIKGVVSNENGEPLANIDVKAEGAFSAAATTDETGVYEMTVAPATWIVNTQKYGFAASPAYQQAVIENNGDIKDNMNFTLAQLPINRVTVSGAEDGTPQTVSSGEQVTITAYGKENQTGIFAFFMDEESGVKIHNESIPLTETQPGVYTATTPLPPIAVAQVRARVYWTQTDSILSENMLTLEDIQPPTTPQNLTAELLPDLSISLSWERSTDNVGVKNYVVLRHTQNITQDNVSQAKILTSALTGLETFFNDTEQKASGRYYYAVMAKDYAGNVSPLSNVVSVLLQDVQPPSAVSDLQAVLVNTEPNQVQLTWTGAADNVGVVRYKVLRIENEPITDANKLLATILTNTLTANTRNYLDETVEAGKTYYYAVTSFDAAGNESALSNSPFVIVPSVQVDTAAPVISNVVPPDNTFVNSIKPLISATITDDASGVNPQKVFVKIDETLLPSTYDALTQKVTATFLESQSLTEGAHTLKITAFDVAGNSASSETTFTVDVTAPLVVITHPLDRSFINTKQFNVTATLTDNLSGIDPATTVLKADGVAYLYSYDETTGTLTYPWPPDIQDGVHEVTIDVKDRAGNSAVQAKSTFTVDTIVPQVTNVSDTPDPFSPGNSFLVKDATTITANILDLNPDMWDLSITNPQNATVASTSGTGTDFSYLWNGNDTTGAAVQDGLYNYTITTKDKAGNTSGGAQLTEQTVLQDDFNGTNIDAAKWTVSNQDSGLSVTQSNGKLKISGQPTQAGGSPIGNGVASYASADSSKNFTLTFDVDLSASQVSTGASVSANVVLGNPGLGSTALLQYYYHPGGQYEVRFFGQNYPLTYAFGTITLSYNAGEKKLSLFCNGVKKTDVDVELTDGVFSFLAAGGGTQDIVDVRYDNFVLKQESVTGGTTSGTITVDNTNPNATLEILGAQYTQNGNLFISGNTQLTIQGSDPVVNGVAAGIEKTQYAVDQQQSPQLYISPFTLPDGPHTIRYSATDNAGNTNPETFTQLVVDATAPVTTLSPTPQTFTKTKTFTLSANDPQSFGMASGVQQILVALDGAPFATYISGLTLNDGYHTLEYFAIDSVGNEEPHHTVTFTVDTTKPEVKNISDAPDPFSPGASAGVKDTNTISANVNDVNPDTWQLQLFDSANNPVQNFSGTGNLLTQLWNGSLSSGGTAPDGLYSYSILATDRAGNTNKEASGGTTTVLLQDDFNGPSLDGNKWVIPTDQPTDPGLTVTQENGQLRIVGTAQSTDSQAAGVITKAVGDTTKKLTVSVDVDVSQMQGNSQEGKVAYSIVFLGNFTSDAFMTLYATLNEGMYELFYMTFSGQSGSLGNVPPTGTIKMIYTPVSSQMSISFNQEQKAVVPVTLHDTALSALAAAGSYGTYVDVRFDNFLFMEEGGNNGGVVLTPDGFITVDNTNPVSTLTPSVALFDGKFAPTSASYSVAAEDPVVNGVNSGIEKIEYAVDEETMRAYTEPFTLTEGIRTVRYNATDNAGNSELGTPNSKLIYVDGTAPSTTLTPSASLFNNVYAPISTSYALSTIDPVSHDVASGMMKTVYKIDGGVETQYSNAITLTEGEHTITCFSKDNVLNTEQEKTFTVKVDNTPPVTQIVPSAPLFANQYASVSTTYTFTSNDPQSLGVSSGVSKIEYTLDGGVMNTYTGQPITLTEGMHTFTFFATDNVGNKEEAKTFVVHVDNTPPTAQISVGAPQCTEDGKVIISATTQLNVSANDTESNNVSSGVKETRYRVNGGEWKVFTGGFTLSQADGDVTIEFQAEDNVGNVQAVQSTTVVLDTTAPTTALLSPQDGSVISGIVSVMGTVTDSHFNSGNGEPGTGNSGGYTLAFGAGQSPSSFTTITTGSTQNTCTAQSTSCDPLGTWNTSALTQDTLYTLKLTATDCVGNVSTVQALLRIGSPTVAISYGEKSTGQPADGEFNQPTGLATLTGSNGQMLTLVADRQNHRIEVFNENGQFMAKFGEKSTGPQPNNGEFNEPTEIAVRELGTGNRELYVVDSLNDRVQKFDKDYNFVAAYGSHGNGAGQFNKPYGIALDAEGNIYITDTNNNRVQKLDASGNFVKEWTFAKRTVNEQDETFTFNKPSGITLDAQGNLIVSDSQNDRVLKFAQDGTLLRIYAPSGDASLKQPSGLALDNGGNLYVADEMSHRVVKFDAFGNVVLTFGGKTEGNPAPEGTFNQVADVQLDATQKFLLVSDVHNHRIQVFALSVSAPPIAKLASTKNDDKNAVIADPNLLNVLKVVPYPTPSKGKLSFNLEAEGNVTQITLEVYTINGKRVLTEFLPVQAATGAKGKGKFKAESPSLDAVLSSLPNGVYVYRLQISNGVKTVNKTGKFVVVK